MTKTPPASIESIYHSLASYYPDADKSLITKAYSMAQQAHAGQKRESGEPYFVHPVEVAAILVDMKLDIASIVTGLLHDTIEDTSMTLEIIKQEFSVEISELVDGVTKLSKITFKTTEEKQAENFRKMIIAMAKDIRVIFVKLADRLNNMRTLEFMSQAKQKIIAQETLDIYAPIANRLGMSSIKMELEDLCLRFLHPDIYYKIAQKISKTKKERELFTEEVTHIIDEKLREYDIIALVTGRAKHFYSIYRKMERRKLEYEQIFDIIAYRIIVESITECYKALGVIHAAYKPIPGRFKDYIAIPKANSYQSLHTSVIGPHGERIEIQIRTQEMHLVAEGGIAAYWKYKEGKFDSKQSGNIAWVDRLLEWHKALQDPNEFLETVKIDLFAEDIFVFTPKGEIKQLPHGATPLDFAYAVHTDVGHHCTGARVNGKMVPLRHRLKSGDSIEIETSALQSPSKDWLKIVCSSRAKAKIRSVIKTQERQRAGILGKELLDKALRTTGTSLNKQEKIDVLQQLAEKHSFSSTEDMYRAIGYGKIAPENMLDIKPPEPTTMEKIFRSATHKSDTHSIIQVAGIDDVLIRFARCCTPLPGDTITGFITRGRGVTVHTAQCTKTLDMDPDRRIDVAWANQGLIKRHVRTRIVATDEPGLLATLSHLISSSGSNITSALVRTTKDRKAILLFDLEVTSTIQLQKMMTTLESHKDVISAERVHI